MNVRMEKKKVADTKRAEEDNNISTSNSKNCNRSSDQDRISSNNFDKNQTHPWPFPTLN